MGGNSSTGTSSGQSGSSQSSQSTSNPQLTPAQLISLYSSSLPSVLGTTTGQANQEANTNLNLLNGTGGQAATAATDLTNKLNPALASANSGAVNAVNAINLNGLSPGEYNSTERALNQSNQGTGNLGLGNNTNAINNAMNFGGAFNSKIGLMNSAVNSATNAGSAMNTAVNPSSFSSNAMSNASQFGNSLLSSLGSLGSASIGQSSGSGNSSSVNNSNQSSWGVSPCCFIFLEATNGKMPWWIRECRDEYYKAEPQVARGYTRMAKWLVPAMRHIPLVKFAVNRWMVQPITLYGGYVKKVEGYEDCEMFECYKKFWFNIWRKVGSM